jgi:nitrite reductase/ring-hydroxylating ferredoxin subunit
MPFVRVARTTDIPLGKGHLVESSAIPVAVFNAGQGRFCAVSALCPHEDGPLADGWLEGGTVVCPWHGFDFDVASGACRATDDLSIAVYRTRVTDGVVEVELP